jgi:low affinity Fe/Cu permease
VLIVYAALWYVFKPETFEWHAVATLATWAMTLVIQRAEHRDTQAIHAKLDEILHALGDARNEITRMDEKEPEEIEQRREYMRKDDCMSSEHFGRFAAQFKRVSGSSGLRFQAAIAC